MTSVAALSVLNGLVGAVAMPAALAITPQTVGPDVLREANLLLRLAVNTALIGGAALGGMLTGVFGAGWALAADSAFFVLAGVCFWFIRGSSPAASEPRAGILTDLRLGWTPFVSRSWLWSLVAFAMVWQATWAGSTNVLGPVIAEMTFGAQGWGFVLGALSLGLVVGSVVALRWRPRRALATGVTLVAVTAVFPLCLGLAPNVYLLIAAAFVSGVALEQFVIAWDLALQQNIPRDYLARVYSYDMLGSFLAVPIGQVAVGPVADTVGEEIVLIGCAVIIVIGVAISIARRSVRDLTSPAPEPAKGADAASLDSSQMKK